MCISYISATIKFTHLFSNHQLVFDMALGDCNASHSIENHSKSMHELTRSFTRSINH